MKFILKKIWEATFSIIISIIISIFFIVLITRSIPTPYPDNRIINSIKNSYKNEYELKILTTTIKPETQSSIIIWGNDKDTAEVCLGQGDIDKKPVFKIYKKNDISILSLIPYFKQEHTEASSFQFEPDKTIRESKLTDKYYDYWISNVQVEDLDGDGSDELIINAISFVCGSGGYQYQFILEDNVDQLSLISTYPIMSYKDEEANKIIETGTRQDIVYNGVKQNIVKSNTDNYQQFVDLDNDGKKELVMGYLMDDSERWGKDPGFCHSCPHYWAIGVYKYMNKEFVADNNWSYGNLYKTEKRIGLYDALGYPVLSNNVFNVLAIYYFNCKDCDTFHNASRRKSELLKIVEEKYGKFMPKDYFMEYEYKSYR